LPQVVEPPSDGEFHYQLEFGNAVYQVLVTQVLDRQSIMPDLNFG
jgi:hypothetical protein